MQAKVVLNSNVITALFFPEEHSTWAERIVESYDILITADLAYAEIGNVAWKRITLFKQDKNVVMEVLKECLNFVDSVVEVVKVRDVAKEALKIASELKITFYDSVYVAITEREEALLAMLDKKLAERIKDAGIGIGLLTPF